MTNQDIIHISSATDTYLTELDYRTHHQGQALGLLTGIQPLDRLLGGLRGGEVIVLAGRPGIGKVPFAVSCISHIARHFQEENQASPDTPKCVLFFNWGSYNQTFVRQLLSGRIPEVHLAQLSRYEYGLNNPEERKTLTEEAQNIAKLPIYLCENRYDTKEIELKIKQLNETEHVSFLVIDNLQQIPDDRAGQKVYARFMKAIQKIARDRDIPVLLLSNLQPEVEWRDCKRPRITDIPKCQSVLPYADKVILVYREAYYLQWEAPEQIPAESDAKYQERLTAWKERLEDVRTKCEFIVENKKEGIYGTVACDCDLQHFRFSAIM